MKTPDFFRDSTQGTLPRLHSVASQGIKLCVKMCPPNSFSKPNSYNTILLVHGLTYSSHEYDVDYQDYSFVNFLARKGYYVWTFDIGGYGNSESPQSGWTVDSEYASRDISNVVDYIINICGIKKLNLMGWSWGTVTTSLFSASNPEKVRRLILYSPFYKFLKGLAPENDWHYYDPAQPRADFQFDSFSGELDYEKIDPMIANLWAADCKIFDGNKSPNGGRKDLLTRDIQFEPQKLTMPVLLIAGSNDPYLVNVDVHELYKMLPNSKSELVLLEGGAHMIMIEKPYYKIFQNSIFKFLICLDD